jgi:hypothetical protein
LQSQARRAWPIPARPNPFIPVALQRAAGVPESSAAASLDLDSRITRGWLDHAEGSVLVEFGATRVLCAASVTEDVPRWRRGSGLGLAIVKKIIEDHPGGALELDSEEGKGTVARITLPLLNRHAPPGA